MKTRLLILIFVLLNQALAFAGPAIQPETANYANARQALATTLVNNGIKNDAVIAAMGKVQRHLFMSEKYRDRAYNDVALVIGKDQTITQPFMVALMSEAIRPKPEHKVLEIGTGTGYSSAVLAELVDKVYTIEIDPKLAAIADERLKTMGYDNVFVKSGDGFYGWAENAPFDAILLTCTAQKVPPRLVEQLKEGGKIIMPLGENFSPQTMAVITKKNGVLVSRPLVEVQFVPMSGEINK